MRVLAPTTLMFFLAGCAGPGRFPQDTTRAPETSGTTSGVTGSPGDTAFPKPFPGWHVARTRYERTGETGLEERRDIGHGVLIARRGDEPYYPTAPDTQLYRAAPDRGAPPVAALVWRWWQPAGWWQKQVWAPEPLTPNLIEYAYEENAIPFDSVDATGRWRRGILGFTEAGRPWTGWLELTPTLRDTTWRALLLDMPLTVEDDDDVWFHDAPDGERVIHTKTLAQRGGFDVTAVEVRGDWIKVKVEHPGESCAGDLPKDRKTDEWWIRGFESNGRPRVFFFTRGC